MPSPRRQPSEELDLSSIQPPVKLGVNGAEQVARCLAGGSEEIKHLLRQECRIIFECCVCSSLFRSLANFLAHKRVYCKEDHMLPSSDLASHVSILRQYIQTKAAAMATLAEGANTQSKPTGSNADIPPENFAGDIGGTEGLPNGMVAAEATPPVANFVETPKKKKVKSASSTPTGRPAVDTGPSTEHAEKGKCTDKSVEKGKINDKATEKGKLTDKAAEKGKTNDKGSEKGKGNEKGSEKGKANDKGSEKGKASDKGSEKGKVNDKGQSAKKRRMCDVEPNNLKKAQVKRKSVGGGEGSEGTNGAVNLGDTFINEKVAAAAEEEAKKTKATKVKVSGNVKPMECSVVMNEKDVVKSPAAAAAGVNVGSSPAKTLLKTTKAPKKDMAPHLLYPCLYCDHVFPGTRMAIDHISAVHKKRKSINVSKIRTKIRKKAFVVKSGKKTRRFQKKSKSLEKGKVKNEEPVAKQELVDDDGKVGKRGHVSHSCSQCGKTYLYKAALDRHEESCQERPVSLSPSGSKSVETSPGSSPGSPVPRAKNSASPGTSTPKSPQSDKKPHSLKGSPIGQNCRVLGEIVLSSSFEVIKAEPDSPNGCPLIGTPRGVDTSGSSTPGSDTKDNRNYIVPVKSEYPCPYCVMKPKRSFEALFQHISEKHKDLRPSRKRVARFLMNAGYKCATCKSPQRFFKNRIMLRRHREKEHPLQLSPPTAKANGTKS